MIATTKIIIILACPKFPNNFKNTNEITEDNKDKIIIETQYSPLHILPAEKDPVQIRFQQCLISPPIDN